LAYNLNVELGFNNVKFLVIGCKMKKVLLVIIFCFSVLQAQNSVPEVSNVNFAMRQDGSKIVDITYDVYDADGKTMFVTVEASSDAGETWNLRINKITGDIGYGIVSGINKKIVWNILKDNPEFYSERVQIKISADNNYTIEEPEMITVLGGTFLMGSNDWSWTQPVHSVTLSTFKVAKFEITQKLWKAIMGSNPSYFIGDENKPVEKVTWNDIQQFITKLNQLTGKNYRLPTEAEWEYAARGGNQSQGYIYAGSNDINIVAWIWNNSGEKTNPVGAKFPNELGIYDMSGNVWELCNDWYGSYSADPITNPQGPNTGTKRVMRGGSWFDDSNYCRPVLRLSYLPISYENHIGARLAIDL